MDLLKKITGELEPLGGELYIDQFVQAQRPAQIAAAPAAQASRTAAAPKPRPKAAAPAEIVPLSAMRPSPDEELEPASDANGYTDTGKLRAEVQEFLNRDEAEGTNDSEVQEFLKERQGFDPSELE